MVLSSQEMRARPIVASVFVALLAIVGGGCLAGRASSFDRARVVPAPLLDEKPGTKTTAVAVMAGGCFWGVQGVYQHVKGVTGAVSGYAGGTEATAEYETVGSGGTGHAESVRVMYDPRVVTYGRLLQVFFSVAHDPTQMNRQGPDVGTQYRSAIFPVNDEQAAIAKAYIAQLTQARTFEAPIATTIEPGRMFYRAEAYHQDFLTRNPSYPYIVINDLPKIADLERLFPDLYRAKPALVGSQE